MTRGCILQKIAAKESIVTCVIIVVTVLDLVCQMSADIALNTGNVCF